MKIFGIGFHKTGTTTLEAALSELGYKVIGPNRNLVRSLVKGDLELVWALAEKYDAFQDNPWPLLYRELDQRFPGSKFVLTYRDPERWMASMVNHFRDKSSAMRRWIYGEKYGAPEGNEDVYLQTYRTHYEEVRKYFESRPKDLLEIDFTKGSGWDELCNFLGCQVPDALFPHKNKRSYSLLSKYLKQIGIR